MARGVGTPCDKCSKNLGALAWERGKKMCKKDGGLAVPRPKIERKERQAVAAIAPAPAGLAPSVPAATEILVGDQAAISAQALPPKPVKVKGKMRRSMSKLVSGLLGAISWMRPRRPR